MGEPTVEAMQKALSKKRMDDALKKLAYSEHQERVKLVQQIKVPYRCIVDALKNCAEDEVRINRFYPDPTAKGDFWDWMQETHPEYVLNDAEQRFNFIFDMDKVKAAGKPISFKNEFYTEEYKAAFEAWQESAQNFHTEGGRRYLFARFLHGFDIATFSEFDLYGTKGKHTAQEIEAFKSDCISLQKQFEAEPGAFFTEHVPRTPRRAQERTRGD